MKLLYWLLQMPTLFLQLISSIKRAGELYKPVSRRLAFISLLHVGPPSIYFAIGMTFKDLDAPRNNQAIKAHDPAARGASMNREFRL